MARRKIDQYRKEAKLEPFILEDDEGNDIVIHAPDTEAILDIGEIPQNQPRRILRKLCGEEYDRVYNLVKHEPPSVLNDLVYDMMRAFDYDVDGVPGGSRALSN